MRTARLVRTGPPSEAQILDDVEQILRGLLPSSWRLDLDRDVSLDAGRRADLVLRVGGPKDVGATFLGEVKREVSGAQLTGALAQLRSMTEASTDRGPLLVASWLSARSQDRLASERVSYVDATGNVRLISDEPPLLLSAEGAAKNPWPVDKSLQSLRGTGAARAVRALTDFTPPYGVRELAGRTEASAATLSRVIDLLERDGVVERDERGAVLSVDWTAAIRRWAQDYEVLRSNDAVGYLQPRGLSSLSDRLTDTDLDYALTGSLAANALAPFAPARLAMLYVSDLRAAVDALELRETESGANVMLLRPFDDVVFARTIERDELRLVNPSQLAVDLLTGPGRAPAEGEELLAWMEENTDAWRS
jgi:hypothetical protein